MSARSSLNRLRSAFLPIIIAALAAVNAVVTLLAWWLDAQPVAVTLFGASLVVSVIAAAKLRGSELVTRHLSAAAMMGLVGLLTFCAAGSHLQIDTHMAYFAALAVVAGWCCWSSILVATGVVAVHHLALNVLYPTAVFPNGTEYLRVVLHAVVLVAEAAALMLAARQLTRALSTAEAATQQALESAQAQLQSEQRARQGRGLESYRQQRLNEVVSEFRDTLVRIEHTVEEETTGMRETALALTGVAAQSSQHATQAETITSTTAQNVLSVSAAAEELTASITGIASQSERARLLIEHMSGIAEATSGDVRQLSAVANRIGTVIGLIKSVADQTNLLALNATIEAARAGEAGRGFAVVASEVKALAGQTMRAADEIVAQVEAIQVSTDKTVTSVGTIAQATQEMDALTNAIAASVDQQQAATMEISRTITQVAQGSSCAHEGAVTVSRATQETQHHAGMALRASETLKAVAADLSRSVALFTSNVEGELTERRREVRGPLDERATVNVAGQSFSVHVTEVSAHGARLRGLPALVPGTRAEFIMLDGQCVPGHIAWSLDGEAGLRLEQAISHEVLTAASTTWAA